MKIKYSILFLICAGMFVQAQEKKAFTIETLYMVKSPGAPVLSHDGKLTAFTLSESDFKLGKSYTDLYLMNSDGTDLHKISSDRGSKSSLLWGENNLLYFIADGQLNSMDVTSGQVQKVTDFYAGVSNPALSPDGKYAAFISDVYPECGADNSCNEHIYKRADEGPVQAYLADDLMFRHWTEYSGGKESAIIIYDLNTKSYRLLASNPWLSGNFMLGGERKFDISPDGKEICYVASLEKNIVSTTNPDLFIIPADGSQKETGITTQNKALDANPVYSPDGKYIAYVMMEVPGFESDRVRIAIYDRQKKTTAVLTENFDNDVEDFCWGKNSQEIFFTAAVEGYTPLYKVNIRTKKIEPVTGERSIFGFEVTADNKILFNQRTVQKPAEIYLTDAGDKNPKQLTSFNDKLLEEYDFRPAEQFWVAGADGHKMQVFMVKPHGFDQSKKYPVIINVHGGPQMQWQDSFRGDWQVYPGAGYIVIFPNPHGSTGYGQEYTNAISGDWGGKTYEDIMLLTDEVEKMPFVDKERIGAMGWSYGGYFMNWLQAKTKRFKCLASMMGIFDIESMWGATEELWFVNWDLKGQPWNSDLYEKYSPSNYVKNFSTPALIITGEKDYRVPYTQSIQYFTTLKTLGIDARLIIFKNDGHWPSNVKSMPLYYNAHLEWFHKYLGGGEAPYDSKKLVTNTLFE